MQLYVAKPNNTVCLHTTHGNNVKSAHHPPGGWGGAFRVSSFHFSRIKYSARWDSRVPDLQRNSEGVGRREGWHRRVGGNVYRGGFTRENSESRVSSWGPPERHWRAWGPALGPHHRAFRHSQLSSFFTSVCSFFFSYFRASERLERRTMYIYKMWVKKKKN